jgi:hypothetical protein
MFQHVSLDVSSIPDSTKWEMEETVAVAEKTNHDCPGPSTEIIGS